MKNYFHEYQNNLEHAFQNAHLDINDLNAINENLLKTVTEIYKKKN